MKKKQSNTTGINLFQRSYYRKSSGKYMGNSDVWLLKGREAQADAPKSASSDLASKKLSWGMFLCGFFAEPFCPSSLLLML